MAKSFGISNQTPMNQEKKTTTNERIMKELEEDFVFKTATPARIRRTVKWILKRKDAEYRKKLESLRMEFLHGERCLYCGEKKEKKGNDRLTNPCRNCWEKAYSEIDTLIKET